jgi:uncharacterized protein YifE (UPF0438 family)
VQGAIVDANLGGHPYVRLHLLGPDGDTTLREAAKLYEYVFAYALVDLGEVEGFTRDRKWSQLITLDDTAETTFQGFHKKVRQEVRKSIRDEETTVAVDDPARDESYDFYRRMKEADGVTPDVEEDFGSVRWINGYHQGELVSLSSWFDSGTVLRAHHSITTRKQTGVDTSLIGRLTRRLSWEACLLGLDLGRDFIDLAGVSPDDPAKAGITAFKQGFGGETVEVHVYRRSAESWPEAVRLAAERGRSVP